MNNVGLQLLIESTKASDEPKLVKRVVGPSVFGDGMIGKPSFFNSRTIPRCQRSHVHIKSRLLGPFKPRNSMRQNIFNTVINKKKLTRRDVFLFATLTLTIQASERESLLL